jgi:hypothetical protein
LTAPFTNVKFVCGATVAACGVTTGWPEERDLTQIIVQFDPDSVSSGEAGKAIQKLAKAHGGSGGPLHPGVSDPEPAAFFSIDIPDSEQAAKALAKVRENRSVVAAYIKPAAELP